MKTRELTRIALMGTILYVVFQAFSDILYLEMITFTILAFSQVFTRRETVLSCLLFAAVHLLLHGIMFWNIAYLIIFPTYGLLFSASRGLLEPPSRLRTLLWRVLLVSHRTAGGSAILAAE